MAAPSPYLSEGSVSPAEVKRTTKIEYFLGKGVKEWNPKDELVYKDTNITKEFKWLRSKSIDQVEKGNDISCLRNLALSHILPLNKFDDKQRVTRYFYGSTRKALRLIARCMKPEFERTSTKAIIYCKKEADVG
ncbi:hypothetical protein INT47_006278 [Mucor saturninus]|uniref:Uncharacterized protein n=1 Tax=Mucor saturninus TaxID=64648 RepID=A0A8H7RHN6_9FUNG|nr:hypothetical protein INT47_006278 [Mucor saturninus]